MSDTESITWRDIWLKKGRIPQSDSEKRQLADLIKFDGFDTGGGAMSEKAWLELVDMVSKKMNLKKGSHLLEIGCGAGAFLYPFYGRGIYDIAGIDYSDSLLKIAKEVMPEACFACAEANALPFDDDYFDSVISNSVFNYFSDYEYAKQALLEIIRVLKKGGECLLLDLNDLSKRDFAENSRRQEIGAERYDELYKDLHQLYFDKQWLIGLLQESDIEFEIFNQDMKDYKNALWRFNLYFKKN